MASWEIIHKWRIFQAPCLIAGPTNIYIYITGIQWDNYIKLVGILFGFYCDFMGLVWDLNGHRMDIEWTYGIFPNQDWMRTRSQALLGIYVQTYLHVSRICIYIYIHTYIYVISHTHTYTAWKMCIVYPLVN